MKIIIAILVVIPVLVFCLVGAAAALCGFKRIDRFCARSLNDTDGQAEA